MGESRHVFVALAACALSVAAAGCAGQQQRAATPDTVAAGSTPSSTPTAPAYTGPHFDTPEAAMRYLAAAWNRHDMVSLRHVTTPDGRDALLAMYDEAVNLRLDHCSVRPGMGDYMCTFDHDYPPSLHKHGIGHAQFVAGPALNPGWYMTVFIGCG